MQRSGETQGPSNTDEVSTLREKCEQLTDQLERTKEDLKHYEHNQLIAMESQAKQIAKIKQDFIDSHRPPKPSSELERQLSQLSMSHEETCDENLEPRRAYDKLKSESDSIMRELWNGIKKLHQKCDQHETQFRAAETAAKTCDSLAVQAIGKTTQQDLAKENYTIDESHVTRHAVFNPEIESPISFLRAKFQSSPTIKSYVNHKWTTAVDQSESNQECNEKVSIEILIPRTMFSVQSFPPPRDITKMIS